MSDTKAYILNVAREEFLAKGYMGVSMRTIANKVGITVAALYKHYESKDELFDSVIYPAVVRWERFIEDECDNEILLSENEGVEAMWHNYAQAYHFVDMMYENIEEQRLLFFGAEGSKYSRYIYKISQKVVNYSLDYMNTLKAKGIHINDIDVQEMLMLLSAQYLAMLEIIRNELPYDMAIHYSETLYEFYSVAWRHLLGF